LDRVSDGMNLGSGNNFNVLFKTISVLSRINDKKSVMRRSCLGLYRFLPKYGVPSAQNSLGTPRDGFGETVILDRFACKTRYEQTLKK